MTSMVALLRGINVGGRNRLAMADLRAIAADLGYRDIATYIQSGNLLFATEQTAARVGPELEAAIAKRGAAAGTMRSWKTVLALAELLTAMDLSSGR